MQKLHSVITEKVALIIAKVAVIRAEGHLCPAKVVVLHKKSTKNCSQRQQSFIFLRQKLQVAVAKLIMIAKVLVLMEKNCISLQSKLSSAKSH